MDPIIKQPLPGGGSVDLRALRPVRHAQASPAVARDVPAASAPSAAENAAEVESQRQAARRAGYEDGKAQALREFGGITAAMRQQLTAVLGRVEHAQAAALVQLEGAACDIAFAGIVKVLGEGCVNPVQVRAAVRQAMHAAPRMGEGRLCVNPVDAELLGDLLSPTEMQSWRVQADPAVERGGCIVRTPRGDVDARIETQLANLAALLQRHRDEGSA
jgi:flagellar biosynthesis/type III secretory pathway protein FliH